MESKISLFDVLSYLLPGLIYFLAFVIIGNYFTEKNLIGTLLNASNTITILIIIFSYMIGHATQPLHKINFLKFFLSKQVNLDKILEPILNQLNPEILAILNHTTYSKRAILERVLKLHNENLANTSSRFLALALFLRNLSSPFLLLAIITPLTHEYLSTTIICLLIIFFLLIAIALLHRHKRFEQYAHKSIVEGIIALNLRSYDFIKKEYKK